MAAEKKYPLVLTIKAVDKATENLRKINKQIAAMTKPFRDFNNRMVARSAEAGLPRIVKGFKGVGSALGNVAGEVASLGLKLGAMAAGAGIALFSIVKGAVQAGDDLATMSQQVGLSVNAYAQLQYAAAQADVSQEEFNGAMGQFNKRLGEAKAGTGGLLEFLKKTSPALAAQVKGAKGTDEAFALMTRAFEKVTDPGKRAALAAAAFGKSGLQMGVFLGQGTDAIEDLRLRYRELAGDQSEFANGASALDNAARETETAFLGLRNATAGALFPALTELAKGLSDVLAGERGNLREWARETGAALMGWVKGGGLKDMVKGLRELATSVSAVVGMIGGLKGVAAVAGLVLSGPLLASIGGLAKALITLGPLAITPAGLALLALGGIAGTVISNWEPIKTWFSDFTGSFRGNFQGISDFVSGVFTLDIEKAWTGIKGIFKSGVTFIATLLDGWVAAMTLPLAQMRWVLGAVGIKVPQLPSFRAALGVGGESTGAATGASTGAAAAAPRVGEAGMAHVQVDFANVPRGVRVSQSNQNTADLGIDLGYAMSTPD